MCACRLVATPKVNGKVRPTAVGETLRRLSAKCLLAKYQGLVAEYLAPEQLGVGVQKGIEAGIFRVEYWRSQSTSGDGILQVDLANAFNTISQTQNVGRLCRTGSPVPSARHL